MLEKEDTRDDVFARWENLKIDHKYNIKLGTTITLQSDAYYIPSIKISTELINVELDKYFSLCQN